MKRTRPLIVGLTGSIGMGKSTVAKMFASLGAPVFSADQIVHDLLGAKGKVFPQIAKIFPQAVRGGRIDKKILGQIVFRNPALRKKLESLLHPLVWQERTKFLKNVKNEKQPLAILEIPLLFETGENEKCDRTICVAATLAQQKKRVLKRKGMTPSKLKAILKSQMRNADKMKKANAVIRTDKSLAATKKQVKALWDKWNWELNDA